MPTEADTCRRFVVPKLQAAGWDNEPYSIAEQRTITDGRIVPVGRSFIRRPSHVGTTKHRHTIRNGRNLLSQSRSHRSVTIQRGEIVVTTTVGTKITIPASTATLAKFVDDLANHVDSNFVSVATTAAR